MLAGHFPERRKIELIEVPEPVLPAKPSNPAGDILFQPELSCLCGSDMLYFLHEEKERLVGHSLHEMIGTVLATNGGRYKAGDRVLVVPVIQQGLYERYVVSADRAVPIDPRLSDELAVLSQPLGTVIFAMRKLPRVLDQDVAVIGLGPIGQMMCATLRNLGARHIIGIDKIEARTALALKMGANAVINNSHQDPLTEIQKITGGQLPDIVIEAVGHSEQVLNLCGDLCKYDGDILYFGVPPERLDAVAWRPIWRKNISVHTSVGPDFSRDFPLAMRWQAEGRLDLRPLVTHRFPLQQVQTAFEVYSERKDGSQKVFIDFPAGLARQA